MPGEAPRSGGAAIADGAAGEAGPGPGPGALPPRPAAGHSPALPLTLSRRRGDWEPLLWGRARLRFNLRLRRDYGRRIVSNPRHRGLLAPARSRGTAGEGGR